MSSDNHKRGPRIKRIPKGDDRERMVCPDCHYIAYENPKLVVGSVPVFEEKILLCKRAIEPRRNFWTLPAGFMEISESMEEGAAREAWEEARAKLQIGRLISAYSVPHISQVHVFFQAKFIDPTFEAGEESLEVQLFQPDEIPWTELAFPTVFSTLKYYLKVAGREDFAPHTTLELNPDLSR